MSAQWLKLTLESGNPVWLRPAAFAEMYLVRKGSKEVTRLMTNTFDPEDPNSYTDVTEHPDAIIAKIHQ